MEKELLYPAYFSLSINLVLLFVYPMLLLSTTIGISIIILCFLYQVFLVFPLVFTIINKKTTKLIKLMENKNIKEKFIAYNNYSKIFWRL